MVTPAPAKARSDVEVLVERFNEWVEERKLDLRSTPSLSYLHQKSLEVRIDTLEFAKKNLERLAKEIKG